VDDVQGRNVALIAEGRANDEVHVRSGGTASTSFCFCCIAWLRYSAYARGYATRNADHHTNTAVATTLVDTTRNQAGSQDRTRYVALPTNVAPTSKMLYGWHHHGLSDQTLSGRSTSATSACRRVSSVARTRTAKRDGTGCCEERTVERSERASDAKRRDVLVAVGVAWTSTRRAWATEVDANVRSIAPTDVYFEIGVDGQPKGRVVVRIHNVESTGGKRFMELAQGIQGVGYRRTAFTRVAGSSVYNAGVRSFNLTGTNQPVHVTGGDSSLYLLEEWKTSVDKHDRAGLVSLELYRDDSEFVPTEKLVATKGKLVTVKDAPPPQPNGSAFAITTAAEPELDRTNLVVGEVVEGMDVIEELQKLPTVKDNSSSPFFMAAKSMGDTRATVAEQAFGRPFARVNVLRSGVL